MPEANAPFELEALNYLLLGPVRHEVVRAFRGAAGSGDCPWWLAQVPTPDPARPAAGLWIPAALAASVLGADPGIAWAAHATSRFAFEWNERGMVRPAAEIQRWRGAPSAGDRLEERSPVVVHAEIHPHRTTIAREAEHLRVAMRRHAFRDHRRGKYRAGTRRLAGWTYRVRPGDSLWRIAKRYLGSGFKWRELWELNRSRVRNPDLIYVGQTLRVGRAPRVTAGGRSAWFKGHRRVGGSFYRVHQGRLVWADTGGPVSGRTLDAPSARRAAPVARPAAAPAAKPVEKGAKPAASSTNPTAAQAAKPAAPAERAAASPAARPAAAPAARPAARPVARIVPVVPPATVSAAPPPPGLQVVASAPAPEDAEVAPARFEPSPWAAAAQSLAFPGSVQWARKKKVHAAAIVGTEIAAVGTLAVGVLTGSRELQGAGIGALVANHVLAGVDALSDPPR